jgi:phospholipase C
MSPTIDHVFVLMLENRSFDHLFAYSGIPGLTGVDTNVSNPSPDGPAVPLSNSAPDRFAIDPGHEFEDVDRQIYAAPRSTANRPVTLDGFVMAGGSETMLCARPSLVPVLTYLARQFVVCDHWFSSMPGPTWPNRFFVHAGSSGGLSNSPSSLTTIGSLVWPSLGFSFQNGTVFDALEKAEKTWRVYHGDHFPQVCAIDTMPSVFVASADQFRKTDDFAADLARGDVTAYTFIEPDYGILSNFRNGNSQHPCGALSAGEQLIRMIAEAVIASPVWMHSLLVILYDEHGGFFDQLPPPAALPPGDAPNNAKKAKNPANPPFEFDRYGIRVPAVIVSPWVKPGFVSNAVFDHASVVRTVFDLLGLPGALTGRDRIATSLRSVLGSSPLAQHPEPIPPATPTAENDTLRTPPSPLRPSPSLDGFTRIAALVHHALNQYRGGMRAHDLRSAIRPQDDLRPLDQLPTTPNPDEARAYIEHVASLVEIHRQLQRAGSPP